VKRDAFDDVSCPFNYTAELRKARETLNLKMGTYVSENPTAGYRELARMFGVSTASLCAIARKYSRKRKPGRRSSGRKVAFDVRHEVAGEKLVTRVTVVGEKSRDVSLGSMRSLIATYYKTNDISRGSGNTAERHVELTLRELERLVYSPSAVKERAKPNVQ
jgi:hypothetical protein